MVRRNYDPHDESDPFFTSHETIMRSKTAEEREAISETLRDIQSAVTNTAANNQSSQSTQQNSAAIGNNHHQQRSNSTPIWEIRYVCDMELEGDGLERLAVNQIRLTASLVMVFSHLEAQTQVYW